MLNNDDFNLLNTLFPAWQQLTTKQQQIISQNASLIQWAEAPPRWYILFFRHGHLHNSIRRFSSSCDD